MLLEFLTSRFKFAGLGEVVQTEYKTEKTQQHYIQHIQRLFGECLQDVQQEKEQRMREKINKYLAMVQQLCKSWQVDINTLGAFLLR